MADPIPPTLLARFSDFVREHLGLRFSRNRWPDLERGLVAALPDLGDPDPETALRRLLAGPPDRRQIEMLATHLTVGETYFFREWPSFSTLQETILPALIHQRRGEGQRLRLWSAGCCTGEEPYSLAILLSRLIPDLPRWEITLLATDINPIFLEKAARGVFGEWSFRNAPSWLKSGYFRKMPDGNWEILRRIREMVIFSALNLADDAYPLHRVGADGMDVILCRNVLIYMAPDQAAAVVGRFYRALADGGYLSVSPAETSAPLFSEFATAAFPGAMFYRKEPQARTEPQARLGTAIRSAPPSPSASSARAGRTRMTPPVDPAPMPEDPLRRARAEANAGRLTEALAWCDTAITADKIDPLAHYLRATILQERGDWDEAAGALRRALFLYPDFVLAHFVLGSLAHRLGHAPEADRHLANALRLLRDTPADSLVPESEGLTAGRLSEIIESMSGDGTAA